MLGDFVFINESADSVTLNSDPYPITSFDANIEQRFDPQPKTGQDGLWPTYDYDGGMEITIEGAILADDSDDYTTKRAVLTTALRHKVIPRTRRTGILQ